MKLICVAFSILFLAQSVFAETGESPASLEDAPATVSADQALCVLSGIPPASYQFKVIKTLKVNSGLYGRVDNVIPKLVAQARSLGADAIIDYTGTQRFGFFPWRFIRPVVRGTAIKWSSITPVDCKKLGGTSR